MNETIENSIDIITFTDKVEDSSEELKSRDLELQAVYDDYYQNVLKSLNTVTTNQNIIIKNDEELIKQVKNIYSSFNVLIFLVGFIFTYTYLRNMIKGSRL